mmetsp:Transcript_14153/g.24045  ORF Transcript_14153/g.24045 Transcript_14153/m.24045 type:complete len:105 (-) Transcript_14153:1585-1899(-)
MLSIRKLANHECLFAVEQLNKRHQDLIWMRAEEIKQQSSMPKILRNLHLAQYFEENPLPEYKYVFCNQNMINLIANAFFHREVSFSEDTFRVTSNQAQFGDSGP